MEPFNAMSTDSNGGSWHRPKRWIAPFEAPFRGDSGDVSYRDNEDADPETLKF